MNPNVLDSNPIGDENLRPSKRGCFRVEDGKYKDLEMQSTCADNIILIIHLRMLKSHHFC